MLLPSVNRDFHVFRMSPTLLLSLPKSVLERVQSVGPVGFGLGLSSYF